MANPWIHGPVAAFIIAGAAFLVPARDRAAPADTAGGQTTAQTSTAKENADPQEKPAEKPAAGADAAPPPTPPPATAEQILEEILRRRPQKPAVQPVEEAGETGPSGATGPAWPDGWQLISRAGRLVRDGNDWLLAFEGDHPDHPEPPIKLLPNLKLEAMVRETRASDVPPIYVVSGEVTLFFNENYLLVRMAMRRPDSGNLSK